MNLYAKEESFYFRGNFFSSGMLFRWTTLLPHPHSQNMFDEITLNQKKSNWNWLTKTESKRSREPQKCSFPSLIIVLFYLASTLCAYSKVLVPKNTSYFRQHFWLRLMLHYSWPKYQAEIVLDLFLFCKMSNLIRYWFVNFNLYQLI